MTTITTRLKISFLLTILILLGTNIRYLNAQNTNDSLKLVLPSDYGQWETIRSYSISNNGNWVVYQVATVDRDQTVHLYNTTTGDIRTYANAESPIFSKNSEWMAFNIVLPGKEAKAQARKNANSKVKPKIKRKAAIIQLSSNDTLELEDVVNYKFSGTGDFVAMKRQKDKVNTLIIRNLITGIETTFGNIKEYAWQDNGTLLAMVIHTEDKVGNAVQLFNPTTGYLKVLNQKNETFSGLKWTKDKDDLFVKRAYEDKNYKGESYHLLYWKNLQSEKATYHIFDQSKVSNFPTDSRVLPDRIMISDDGNKVYFNTFSWDKNTKDQKAAKKDTDSTTSKKTEKQQIADVSDDDEAPDLEIWNSSDVVIIPAQKKSRMKDIESPNYAVWEPQKQTFRMLTDAIVTNLQLQLDTDLMIGMDIGPYEFEAMFGRPSWDIYTINSNTGDKKKVLSNISRAWPVSPNSQYFIYLNADNLHLFEIEKGTSINCTANLDANFINFESDHPRPQKPPFGFGGWSSDSKSFFIYSEFDVWQVFTNGSPSKRITNGKENKVVYRYHKFDFNQDYINMKKPVYFSMNGKWSKKSGYALGVPGKTIETLIYDDFLISRPRKTKNSDKVLITKQSFEHSPNVYLTNSTLNAPKQISNTNDFQKDYSWGKAELISYKNALGKDAQGILYYPANYQKGKKFPMITYIYEKLTQGIHRYQIPSRTNYYSTQVWVQNGYFVLKPDIEFIPGDPGISSAKTLENAVAAVLQMGDVAANKVGLIGHSWGGYQAGFVPTQTDIFAASVAGAGLTDFISMNLAVSPAFGGQPENNHFEVGQERMMTPPWKSPENYLRNSSVMNIENLNTPILFEVGDNDTNVDWRQGIEYYNAARRAGKPFVLLVYANEGHGLRKEKNTVDYQQRILKWFGHYLKDEKAEDWILKGVPYAEQQRRLKNWKK